MFETLWVLSGLIGVAILWRIDTWSHKPRPRCPTPRAVFFGAMMSIWGPAVWVPVLVYVIAVAIIWYVDLPKKDTWWTRPLCK